jgi:diguanylate cyclase (GGDEF)-like protein
MVGYMALSAFATRTEASAFATVLLAANVILAGRYFLKEGVGFARKAVGWVLLAYAPLYIASVGLEYLHPGSQISSILILVGDFVLNNAFVVGLFAIMEEKARYQLRQLAITDQLTGALNRAGLLGKFPGGRITDARAFLIADLDHFKGINDTFGHAGGDAALKAFVSRVREHLQAEEFIARLGGEEFGILLATGDLHEASLRAEQIRMRFAVDPVLWDGRALAVTASIGVAVSKEPEGVEALISRADDALYRAKRGGRNLVAA